MHKNISLFGFGRLGKEWRNIAFCVPVVKFCKNVSDFDLAAKKAKCPGFH